MEFIIWLGSLPVLRQCSTKDTIGLLQTSTDFSMSSLIGKLMGCQHFSSDQPIQGLHTCT